MYYYSKINMTMYLQQHLAHTYMHTSTLETEQIHFKWYKSSQCTYIDSMIRSYDLFTSKMRDKNFTSWCTKDGQVYGWRYWSRFQMAWIADSDMHRHTDRLFDLDILSVFSHVIRKIGELPDLDIQLLLGGDSAGGGGQGTGPTP